MTLSLFILGSLADETSNPYKLKKKLLEALPIHKMSEGKFYYNFESLQKKGYIEIVETIHKENRPNITMYGITKDGRQFLEQEIYKSFKKASKIDDLYISIYLVKFIHPAKAADLLEGAIEQERKRWNKYKEAKRDEVFKKQFEQLLDEKQKKAIEFIGEHAFNQSDDNIRWMERLLDFLKGLED